MATEKQLVKDLREELQKVREAAQLAKEAAKAEKQATYTLGVEETQVRGDSSQTHGGTLCSMQGILWYILG